MPIRFEQMPPIGAGETGEIGCDFTRRLKTTETLVSGLTMVEVGRCLTSAAPNDDTDFAVSTNLTLTNKAINAATVEINRETVAIGKAATCNVAGQVVNYTYLIRVTATTSRGAVVVRDIWLPVV